MKMRFRFDKGTITEDLCGGVKYEYKKVLELLQDLRKMDTPEFRTAYERYQTYIPK